jgi:hypothetical protein
MKRARILGLGLTAVLAMAALGAASASAEAPEFGRCVKALKGTGPFKNAGCTVAVTGGSYEWMPGPGTKDGFTLAPREAVMRVIETVGGTPLICHDAAGTGEYTGQKTVGAVVLTLSGCETGSVKCNSAGQTTGTAVTSPLEGALGIVKRGEAPALDKIGLALFHPGEGGLILHVDCAGLPISVRGSVIGAVSTKSMKVMSTLKFKQTKGRQKPEQFEGESPDVLEWSANGGPFEQAGLGFEATQTNEEPIEVNPVV